MTRAEHKADLGVGIHRWLTPEQQARFVGLGRIS